MRSVTAKGLFAAAKVYNLGLFPGVYTAFFSGFFAFFVAVLHMRCLGAAVGTFNVAAPAAYVFQPGRSAAVRAILQVMQFDIFKVHTFLLKFQ